MLSSSSRSVLQQPPPAVLDADQDSCAPASKDDAEIGNRFPIEPQPISMLAPNQMVPELNLLVPPRVVVSVSQQPVSTVPRGMFECKACKKVFTSHQALGGHRASHKKVKRRQARQRHPHHRALATRRISRSQRNYQDQR